MTSSFYFGNSKGTTRRTPVQNLREIHSYNFEQSAVEFLATDDFRFGGLPPNRKQKTGSFWGNL